MRGFGPQHVQNVFFSGGKNHVAFNFSLCVYIPIFGNEWYSLFYRERKKRYKIIFLKMSSGLKEIVSRSPFVECKSVCSGPVKSPLTWAVFGVRWKPASPLSRMLSQPSVLWL